MFQCGTFSLSIHPLPDIQFGSKCLDSCHRWGFFTAELPENLNLLTLVNNAEMNMGVQICLQDANFHSFG